MSFEDLHARFDIDAKEYFANEIKNLQDMQTDGLVQIDEDGITILPKGRILGRSIAMVFDEYLGKNTPIVSQKLSSLSYSNAIKDDFCGV